MRFLLVLAVFALLLLSSGGAAARTSGVSPSTHGLPQVGDPGVQFTCLDAAYSCVAGSGYTTLTAEASGWPWTDYGGTNASTNAAGSHNCTLYSAFRLEQEGANQPSWYDNAPGWATKAAASGTPVDQNPTAGSIAQWNTGVGHVAYVEAVTASSITVTGDNYYTASRVVDGIQLKGGYTETVVIQRSSPDWPDNFIHFTVARSTTPNSYEGHMVHSSDDTKFQKTSYLSALGARCGDGLGTRQRTGAWHVTDIPTWAASLSRR